MGAPPSEEQMAQLLSDPHMIQSMNAALDNPQFLDHIINAHPYLRNVPNAREVMQSPMIRSMLTNPDMMRTMMRMQRASGQQAPSFPAPGATDTTPAGAPASGNANPGGAAQGAPPNPFAMPPGFMSPFGLPNLGAAGADPAANPFAALLGLQPSSPTPGASTTPGAAAGGNTATSQTQRSGTSPPTATTPGAGAAQPQLPDLDPNNPFAGLFQGTQGMPLDRMQEMMHMWSMANAVTPPQADTRPPEERYAEQLRQLNDMGFYDFDRNVAALRRSGGSVNGAIEHLLNG
jgi:ubiquilin